jgi:hypothetical protein
MMLISKVEGFRKIIDGIIEISKGPDKDGKYKHLITKLKDSNVNDGSFEYYFKDALFGWKDD